jgi:hypothetical protein
MMSFFDRIKINKCVDELTHDVLKSQFDTLKFISTPDDLSLIDDAFYYWYGHSFIFDFGKHKCVNEITRDMFANNKEKRNTFFESEINDRLRLMGKKFTMKENHLPFFGYIDVHFSQDMFENNKFYGFVENIKK